MHEVRTVNYCVHNVLQWNLLYGAMNGIQETVISYEKKKKKGLPASIA